jgi:hypothetical protein
VSPCPVTPPHRPGREEALWRPPRPRRSQPRRRRREHHRSHRTQRRREDHALRGGERAPRARLR